jgi:hypothetical protein
VRTVKIGNETLRVSAGNERALLILDAHNGCAMTSKFSSHSGGWTRRDEIDEKGLGIRIRKHFPQLEHLAIATEVPPWVRDEAEAHPRAQTLVYIAPESYDRFDEVVAALKR